MLIGGTDGNLYKLDTTDTAFTDNGISYASDTYIRSGFYDFGLPFQRKHNKQVAIEIGSGLGFTATLSLYKNLDYTAFYTTTLDNDDLYSCFVTDMGYLYLSDMTDYLIQETPDTDYTLATNRFNFQTLMWGLSDIYGANGVEIKGLTFRTAIIGGL
jgi:hypothetical protein